MTRKRYPLVAALLSLAVPGLGHLYAGYPEAAAIAYAAVVVSAGVWVASVLASSTASSQALGAAGLLAFVAFVLLVFVVVPLHAAWRAGRQPATYELRRYNRWYVYLGLYLVLAVLLQPRVWADTKRRLEAFRVPSGSMEPTMLIGDYLFVDKRVSARERIGNGSVVVFESVEEPGLKVIKRVVGLPGDTLTMTAGTLRRNGREVGEPYVIHGDPTRSEDPEQRAKMRAWQRGHTVTVDETSYAPDLQTWGPIVVPPDSFFGLGDNRESSYDSRYYGFIPVRNIIGQPGLVYFSLVVDTTGTAAGVRWSRIGRQLHVPVGRDAPEAERDRLGQNGPRAGR